LASFGVVCRSCDKPATALRAKNVVRRANRARSGHDIMEYLDVRRRYDLYKKDNSTSGLGVTIV
jgi:hypothetical protein